ALLARTRRVIWVEPVTLGRPFLFSPREAAPGIWRMTLPEFPLNARALWVRACARAAGSVAPLRGAVRVLQRLLLSRALRVAGVRAEDTVCLAENFLFMPLGRALGCRRTIFDYIDDVFGFTDFPAYVRRAWLRALERADAVTVTSSTLRSRVTAAVPRSVEIVPNGVEYARFAGARETRTPEGMPAPGTPVAGYAGSIYPWIDFALLEEALGMLEEFHFVMIGHVHPEVRGALARLSRHSRFHYCGARPYTEVPAYVGRFAAGLIPFRRTLLTEGVNPVKLYEYAAAGVPAVATDFSDDTRAHGDIVFIASSAAEFAAHIRTASRRRADPAFVSRLREFARANDWEERARKFSDLLHLTEVTP
ncbi:MAG TPA: glycosyltransferase, partial [Bacteroidota bacterium]|nr:glycosyltransferase [Bacteroidota bacterium]